MQTSLRDQIASLIRDGLDAAQKQGELPAFEIPSVPVDQSRQEGHGDYGSSVCLKLAREAHMNPLKIAETVIAHIPDAPFTNRIEPAAPGYINVWLDQAWLGDQVEKILGIGEGIGRLERSDRQRVQVEFVSANPTGPLTIGSARNAVLGDALASVLKASGHEVEREYYVNNAGSQVRWFGESILARYSSTLGEDVPFPENGYQGEYVIEMGEALASDVGRKYLDMDRGEAVRALAEWGIEQVLAGISRDLDDLGVRFDTWRHEGSLYEEGLFDHVLGKLRESGHIIEYDDAVWFRHPDLEKDAVLIRSPKVIPEPSERPTYLASDTAYVWDKLVERGFDRAIYVWGADHHGDVPRVMAATQALGIDPERVTLILYQLVTLLRGGEEVRMSTRAGEFVTLREVLDEVGPDPIRFMLLARTADAMVDFDLDLAVEQSDRNPVYYVQYAHARIASILNHARELGWKLDQQADSSQLTHPSELALIRKMLELPEVIQQAADNLSPHYLPYYAQELAAAFHSFYRDCRVVSSEPDHADLSAARLRLVQAVKAVLARVLQLMGMSAPERM